VATDSLVLIFTQHKNTWLAASGVRRKFPRWGQSFVKIV